MAHKINSTYNELKRQSLKPRSSVESVKNVVRKQFRDRLRQLRNDNLNNVRRLSNDFGNLKLIKNNLHIEACGLSSSEILEIIEEVERDLEFELLKRQSEEYEYINNEIIEDMLKDVSFCPICDKNVGQDSPNAFCEQCSNSMNNF